MCWIVLVSLSFLGYVTLTSSVSVRLPIGALFDYEFRDIYRAFHNRVDDYNKLNATTGIRLEKFETILDVNNTFELNRATCCLLGKGVLAIFGSSSLLSQPMVQSMARFFRMPLLTQSVPPSSSSSFLSPSSSTFSSSFSSAAGRASGPSFSGPVTFGWKALPMEYTVYVRPKFHRAVVDVVIFYDWKDLVYLCDTNEGTERFQELVAIRDAENLNITTTVFHFAILPNGHSRLRRLDSQHLALSQGKNYILDFSTDENLQIVIKQIVSLGMHRTGYSYIVASLNLNELQLDRFSYGGATLTGFRLIPLPPPTTDGGGGGGGIREDWRKISYSQGTSGEPKLNAALAMDSVSILFHGLRSLAIEDHNVLRQTLRRLDSIGRADKRPNSGCEHQFSMPWTYGSTILKHLRQVNFMGVTGRVSFDSNGFRQNYQLDVLQTKLDQRPKKVGEWHHSTGIQLPQINLPQRNISKQVPSNVTRIVLSVLSAPFLMRRRQQDSGPEAVRESGRDVDGQRYEGFCYDLTELVAESIGFNYSFRINKDERYGMQLANGSWNGMIGELIRKEADLIIAPLTITAIRERFVDFSIPFMSFGISIMIKRPDKLKPGVFSFLEPLSLSIWVCIVFAYLVVSFVLFLVSRMNAVEWGHVTQSSEVNTSMDFVNNFTFQNSLWFALGGFMRQGCDISPRSFGGRVAGSSWWFFTLIIISSYTANLAAFLTVERTVTPIESADDLAKQSEILYGTLESGSTKEFFQTTRVETYQRMWSFMRLMEAKGVFVNSVKTGVDKVRNSKGKYAFLLESTMNDYYNQRKPCNTIRVGQLLDYKGYGIATPIGSGLRDSVSLAVLKLMEEGELKKLQKKWWYDKGECPTESDAKTGSSSSQSALTLSNVAGIFYILIVGLSIAVIVSILQFLCVSKIEANRHRKVTIAAYRKMRFHTCSPLANEDAIACAKHDRGRKDCPAEATETEHLQPCPVSLPAFRSSVISLV